MKNLKTPRFTAGLLRHLFPMASAIALAASAASAQTTIWTEDFEGLPLGSNTSSVFGCRIGDGNVATGDYGVWFFGTPGVGSFDPATWGAVGKRVTLGRGDLNCAA